MGHTHIHIPAAAFISFGLPGASPQIGFSVCQWRDSYSGAGPKAAVGGRCGALPHPIYTEFALPLSHLNCFEPVIAFPVSYNLEVTPSWLILDFQLSGCSITKINYLSFSFSVHIYSFFHRLLSLLHH